LEAEEIISDKEYVKHQVVLPNNAVEQIGWSQGDRLEARVSRKGILL